MARTTPSFKGLKPASEKASKAARGSSKKADTKPEKLLRSALWKAGLRFRKNVKDLPGKPDIVFTKAKVAIFVDGDFWHGREWEKKKASIEKGSSPEYWTAKIENNIARDSKCNFLLDTMGWKVLRIWEADIYKNVAFCVIKVQKMMWNSNFHQGSK